MSKRLIIPQCVYCGSDCTPMGEKKLKTVKKVFCNDSCKEKNKWLEGQLDGLNNMIDQDQRVSIEHLLRNHIDLKYTANKILSERSTVIYTDSLYSFPITAGMREVFYSALDKRADEMMGRVQGIIKNSGKKRVRKPE